ncbi:MAG TPA: YihY family inner membrane protein [Telluria sp.]|nr:YihY family inner membrane protein [Telluria sp.]
MLQKTVHSLSAGVDIVRGLTLSETRDLFRFARRRLTEERLPQVAGSLTFTTVLALVPLLTIVFAIFTTFPVFVTFRKALEAYFVQSLMPKTIANTIVANLTLFASKAKGLSVLGAVALLITSTAMMGMIERAFNQIWRVRAPRPLSQRLLIYWSLVTLGPILIGLSLTMTSQLFGKTSDLYETIPFLGAFLYTTASVLLTTGAFTLLYMAVPNRFVNWRDAMWGGIVAALAFEIAKRLFAIFIKQFPTYAIIYGALAALPIFLVWVYMSWLITLVGAVLAAALPVVKYERWWYQPAPGGEFVDAMAILNVLHAHARVSDSALVSPAVIRAHTRIGYDEMGALLDRMCALGWVGKVRVAPPRRVQWGKRVAEATEHWVLLMNPARVKVADVYRLFVFQAVDDAARREDEADDSSLRLDAPALARQVEAAVEQGLDETLADYFARGQLKESLRAATAR